MSTRTISRWCEIPSKSPVVGTDLPPLCPAVAHSARLVSAHRAAVIAMSSTVSRTRDPQLLRFWLLAVTEWLPVERRLVRSHRAGMPPRGHDCKLCGAAVETVRHVCVCPVESSRVSGTTRLAARSVSSPWPASAPGRGCKSTLPPRSL